MISELYLFLNKQPFLLLSYYLTNNLSVNSSYQDFFNALGCISSYKIIGS